MERVSSLNSSNSKSTQHKRQSRGPEHHSIVINATLADFHKTQCYFVIALQVAALVISYAATITTFSTPVDRHFLLLVSANGLIPIVLTFYTLMTFGEKSWYMIVLSVVAVLLSSGTGTTLVAGNLGDSGPVSEIGDWPACGYNSPTNICDGIGENARPILEIDAAQELQAYIIVMVITTTIAACLVLWKIITESTTMWVKMSEWVAQRVAIRIKRPHVATEVGLTRHKRVLRIIEGITKVVLHSLVVSSLLACLCIELFYFEQIFKSPYVDKTTWGFGQIVGITAWFGFLVELAYLQYSEPQALLSNSLGD
jgi:hypothetical protein